LLKSELYGLRSTLAPEVLAKLDRHYVLLGTENRTSDEQAELLALGRELNEMSVSRTHPNPYFEKFAGAMARHAPAPTETSFTPEEVKEQTALADELLKEVLAEEAATEGRT